MIKLALLFAFMIFFGAEVSASGPPIGELFPASGGTEVTAIEGVQGDNTDDKFLLHYVPRLTSIFIKFVAPIVLVVLILAGIKMIISGDQQEEVEKGKKVILYSVIGVVLILLSYSIIRAVYYFFAG